MNKVSDIREVCGDYAIDIKWGHDEYTLFFNSRRNAETVKKCIEVDDSIPNVATAVDFVEVVHCKDCKYGSEYKIGSTVRYRCLGRWDDSIGRIVDVKPTDFCSYWEKRKHGDK